MAVYSIAEEVKYLEKFEFLAAEQKEINDLIRECIFAGADLTRPGVELQAKTVSWKAKGLLANLLWKLEMAEDAATLGSMEAAKAARRAENAKMRAERLAKEAKEPPLGKEPFRSRPNWVMGVDGRPVYY